MVILVEKMNSKIFTLTAVFAVLMVFVAFSGCIGGAVENKPTPTQMEDNAEQPKPQPNSTIANTTWTNTTGNKTGEEVVKEAVAQAIADGTYSDEVEYAYHSGNEEVTITLRVEKDVVKEASVVPSGGSSSPVSIRIIGKFNDALPDLVVGKKITELNIPKNVAGSSLTTAAFKSYVERMIVEN